MLRNNIEKIAKIKDLRLPKPFQNPFKNLSKSMSKKRAIFHGFVFEKCFVAQAPTSISYWFLQCFVLARHFSWFRCSHAFSIQKTYQKLVQNEVRYLQKSMLKTLCFSISIFSRLGVGFPISWASKIEPSWSFWLPKTRGGAPFEPS